MQQGRDREVTTMSLLHNVSDAKGIHPGVREDGFNYCVGLF